MAEKLKVYALWHCDYEGGTLIGLYYTEDQAKAALQNLPIIVEDRRDWYEDEASFLADTKSHERYSVRIDLRDGLSDYCGWYETPDEGVEAARQCLVLGDSYQISEEEVTDHA